MTDSHVTAFANAYGCGWWGGGSGPGSLPESTVAYRGILERLLRHRRIRRVVDLGCGDWAFSQLIDWSGVDYLGVDIVPEVIKSNVSKYSKKNIRFGHFNIRCFEMPDADLYIVKDVLQHWPNCEIQSFLKQMKGRQMLITNTLPSKEELLNADIGVGDFRALDLLAHPFNLRGATIALEYVVSSCDRKQVLLVNGTMRHALVRLIYRLARSTVGGKFAYI